METMNRPISLADALVLIAATAAGFALTRDTTAIWRINQRSLIEFNYKPIDASEIDSYALSFGLMPSTAQPSLRVQNAVFRATPCLAAWTVTAWGLLFRRPRERWSRLARRPGASAVTAVGLALMANALLWPPLWQPCVGPGRPVPPARYWDTWAWTMMTWSSLPKDCGSGGGS